MTFLVAKNLSTANLSASGVGDALNQFGYDATETRGKRRSAKIYHTSEDRILDSNGRKKLQANASDLARNFAIASWMIRRHLDYVASFGFHCRTGDVDFNNHVEQFIQQWSRPYNCDAAGRHSLPMMLRIAEIRRVIDGDCGILKLSDGSMQGIESDRIKDPKGDNIVSTSRNEWIHGVRVNKAGRALQYSIYRRDRNGLTFDRVVPASRMCMLGYFDRFDQVRGISPLASALNPLRDVYENFDLALAKAKVSQLFALAFYREAEDGMGDISNETEDEDEVEKSKYDTDFGKGPKVLDLDPGDRAEFLESKNPSTEFQNFTELVLQVALKALDIPFSFYNESFTNFFGSRAAWLHYQRSCKPKQQDLQDLLNRLTIWRLMLAILDGDLVLPRGMTLGDVAFEWVPTGMPWWDPAKEINGDLLAISAGLDNPQRIVKERGRGDWYDNVDRIAEAVKYAKEKGVPLSFLPQANEIVVQEATQ